MKKIFTLIAVALATMSVNAQEKYVAIERNAETGVMTLSEEFKAVLPLNEDGSYGDVATNKDERGSVVVMKTASVTVEAVGGSTPADVADIAGDNTATHVDINPDGTVNSWNDIKWQQKNQGDINWAWIQGTGNPAAAIEAEVVMTDDVPATYVDADGVEHTKYRPKYTFYNPDGSLGVPEMGLYYKVTATTAGTIKIGTWVNKGNRKTYVVDAATALPIAYLAEGYINGVNETYIKEDGTEASRKKYLTTAEIDSIHKANCTDATTGEDTKPYVIGAGDQPFFGYITFEMEAGKTYYVFCESTQLGFNGWEFTAVGGGQPGDDQPSDEPTVTTTTWNFKSTATTNEAFAADANWTDSNGDGSRWTYEVAPNNEPLMLSGAELAETKGLLFKASAGKIRLDRDDRLGLSGNGISFTIPGLKAGDVVTVLSQSANAGDAPNRYLSPSNLNITSGFCAGMENGEITNVGTVIADGDVVITTVKGINIYSITVTSTTTTGIESVETTVKPVNNVIYNLSGQKVDANYKGIVIVNGKKFFNK